MLNFLKDHILSNDNRMISYAEYMQLALYHPVYGYYMKKGEKVGKKGDFYTTSNIADIYGRVVAKWYFKLTGELSLRPAVCEIGAGNGRFAAAFIHEWKKISDTPLHYYIVEESPYHREKQKQIIEFDHYIKQIERLEEIKPFKGLVFSNELFDALPVHVIEKKKGQLSEVMVTIQDGQLAEYFVALENEAIIRFIQESNIDLRENQRIEIPLLMKEMVSNISACVEEGIVLTTDYGYTDEEWMEPVHRAGSLRGYYKHEQINNALNFPGEMDITAHVHFDSLIRFGEEIGLRFIRKLRQDHFLLSIGVLEELQDHQDSDPFSEVSRRNRAIRSLIVPSGISAHFHVILQEKGLESGKESILSSLKSIF